MSRWMSKLSPSGKWRSSRLAEPFSRTMTLPSGTVWPWSSTSRVT